MEFTLYYEGQLRANGRPEHKHAIRKHFHIQLKELWNQLPLNELQWLFDPNIDRGWMIRSPGHENWDVRKEVGNFTFAALVTSKIDVIAELNITLLRLEPPGQIVTQTGDIDNRLKTLLDSLKVPSQPDDLPSGVEPDEDEKPFFVLLEDDNLLTKLSVETDRLLVPTDDPSNVVLFLHVDTKTIRNHWANRW